MRTYAYALCVLVLLLFAGGCREKATPQADLYSTVPKSSVVLIESQSILESLHDLAETAVFQQIDSLPLVLAYSFDLKEAGSLYSRDSLVDFFEDRQVLISLALSGAKKYDLLYATIASPEWEGLLLRKLQQHYVLESYTYSEQRIHHIKARESFYFCSMQGIWLASSNKNLVEEAVRQVLSGFSLRKEASFEKLHRTANKKEQANVYVNLQEATPWLRTHFPEARISFLNSLGSWAELDLELFNKDVLLSGISLLPSPDQWFLNTFKGSTPKPIGFKHILPAAFSSFVSYHFNSAEAWHRKYIALQEAKGNASRLLDFRATLKQEYALEADEHLLFWIDDEVGVFQSPGGNKGNAAFGFLKSRDTEQATLALEKLSDPNFIEGYRGVVIKRLAVNNPHYHYFGSLFSGFGKPYYFEFGGYILYTSNLAALKGVINDFLAGNTAANQEGFDNFNQSLGGKAHVHAQIANPAFLQSIRHTLPQKEQKNFAAQIPQLAAFSYGAVQFTVEEGAAYTNLYLRHDQAEKEKVSRQWSVVLEAPAINAPQFVLNHNNRKYEILIQDSNYKLYLVDRRGKILWTKPLDGPILGNATQIDIFKNRKLQLVFNTAERIYVLDRLGRHVENFPLPLKETATAPMAVFDYDKTRSYRLLVPCGQQLLNYGVDGKKVKGWQFAGSKSAIRHIPQHFSVGKKDLITVYDEEGNLYFLYRNGKERYNRQNLKRLGETFYLKPGKTLEDAQLLNINKDGKLVVVNVKAEAEQIWMDKEKPAEHFTYFDGRYIYSSGETLIHKNPKNPWSAVLDGNISSKPKAMIFKGDFYTAAYSEKAEGIYLYDKEGELVEGFPAFAQGPFDMGSLSQDGVINMVTLMEDGTLVCYAVN